MPVTVEHIDEEENSHNLNWMAGLEIEIPLSKILNLETGLRYKYEIMCKVDHTVNHLELPIRLTYKHKLNENLSLRAGVGPYLGVGLEGDGVTPKIGIEPAVAVDWKCLSFGLTYNKPYYVDERRVYKANSGLMLTLGLRFGSRSWKYVGPGLLAAGAVAGAIYGATQGGTNASSASGSTFSDGVGNSSSEGGSRSRTCTYCKGNGICKFCKGSGQGPRTVFGTNTHVKCDYCHGKKICQECHGKGVVGSGSSGINGKTSNSVSGSCKDCHGSGKCGECDGTGVTYVAGHASKCWKCNGNRKCTSCKGGVR